MKLIELNSKPVAKSGIQNITDKVKGLRPFGKADENA